jgi:hypothetical protein
MNRGTAFGTRRRLAAGISERTKVAADAQENTLPVIGYDCDCTQIALRSFLARAEAAQQIGQRGMQEVIIVEIAGVGKRIAVEFAHARSIHL